MTPLVKKILVDSDRHKITMAQNSRKRYLLLPINHIIIKLQWHTKVYVKMFDDHVNIKVPQTLKLEVLSKSFHTLIWRPGDRVQNLESPRLSGRVESTAPIFTLEFTTGQKQRPSQPQEILNLETFYFALPLSPANINSPTDPQPPFPAHKLTQPPWLRPLCEVVNEVHAIKICFHHCNDEIIFVAF